MTSQRRLDLTTVMLLLEKGRRKNEREGRRKEKTRQKYNTVGQTGWCLDCDQEVIMRVFSGKCSANESLDLIISTGYLRPPFRSLAVKHDLVYMALPFISHPHARSNTFDASSVFPQRRRDKRRRRKDEEEKKDKGQTDR